MTADTIDLQATIAETKANLKRRLPCVDEVFRAVAGRIRSDIAEIAARSAAGESIVPEIAYTDIVAGRVRCGRLWHGCL